MCVFVVDHSHLHYSSHRNAPWMLPCHAVPCNADANASPSEKPAALPLLYIQPVLPITKASTLARTHARSVQKATSLPARLPAHRATAKDRKENEHNLPSPHPLHLLMTACP